MSPTHRITSDPDDPIGSCPTSDDSKVTITFDLDCFQCGYNLRTLDVNDGTCPECGAAVRESFRRACAEGFPSAVELADEIDRRRFDSVAKLAGVQRDAVLFVNDALTEAAADADMASADPGRRAPHTHVSAGVLCTTFRRLARQYFNDEAEGRELLTEWGITRSEDVGRIVFAMIALGHAVKRPEDSLTDFAGLFTLETIFDESLETKPFS